MDWYGQEFGACPHGYVKPYCGQCASDDVDAAQAERREAREHRRERKSLEATVSKQSAALDGAYAYIRRLERRERG